MAVKGIKIISSKFAILLGFIVDYGPNVIDYTT